MFVIRAPSLVSLHLDIPFSLDAGKSLVRARISLADLSPRSNAMLLGSLCNVISFELTGLQAMIWLLYKKPCFPTEQRQLIISSICFSLRTNTLQFGFCFYIQGVLDEKFDEVPIFNNLRTLSIDLCILDLSRSDVRKLKALGRFLQKSPNLERLTLKHFKVGVLNVYLL